MIFKNKAACLISAFMAGSLALLLLFGILFFLSDYLETSLKLFGVKKGFVLAIPVLAMSVTSFTTGTFIKKQVSLMKKLVIIGFSLMVVTLGILPFLRNPWYFVGIMSATGIGVGLILPCLNTLITSAVSIQERGMVTSLYGGVRFFGVAGGPPLFGFLNGFGRYVMFWSSAGAALLVGIICLFALPSKAQAQSEKDNQNSKNDNTDTTDTTDTGKSWRQVFLDTITFKNTIGKLVMRKPLKNDNDEASDSSNNSDADNTDESTDNTADNNSNSGSTDDPDDSNGNRNSTDNSNDSNSDSNSDSNNESTNGNDNSNGDSTDNSAENDNCSW